jgi:hypothetical protein
MTWEQFWDHINEHYSRWPTLQIFLFEIAVVAVAILAYRYLNARVLRFREHFILVAIGVFILEFFTAPMWENRNLGVWAYVYSDVTWIFTIAWTTMILGTVYAVDRLARQRPDWQRFLLYLVVLTPMALVFESLNVGLGIRAYAPETLAAAGPWRIPVLDVPAAGLYYVPVFMTLALSFYRFWLPAVEPGGEIRTRVSLPRRLLLTALAVFMFELIVEPMATNQGFPEWSYVFHDITIVMTGLWVILVTVCTFLVDRLMPKSDFRLRFAAYLGLLALIATPIEGWFISAGYRVYGPSATADFIGIRTLIGDLPVEVVAAIPLYLALVIAFVRYWDRTVARGLEMQPRQSNSSRAAPAADVAPQSAS